MARFFALSFFLCGCQLQMLNEDTGTLKKLRILQFLREDANYETLYIVDKEPNPRDVHVRVGLCPLGCPLATKVQDVLVESGVATRVHDSLWVYRIDLSLLPDTEDLAFIAEASDGTQIDTAYAPAGIVLANTLKDASIVVTDPLGAPIDSSQPLTKTNAYAIGLQGTEEATRWHVSANARVADREQTYTSLGLESTHSGDKVYAYAVTQTAFEYIVLSVERDEAPPRIFIAWPAPNGLVGPTFTLQFSVEATATYACQLDDGQPIVPCAPGQEFSAQTNTTRHRMTVTGTNAAGASSATVEFDIDDRGPQVILSGGPEQGQIVNTTYITYELASAEPEPVTFECNLNDAPTFTACDQTYTLESAREGTYHLEVRARDRFGNVGPVTSRDFTIEPLATTFFAIRTTQIPQATRVIVSSDVRLTVASNGSAMWAQEVDGTAPSPGHHGMKIWRDARATLTPDPALVPGRALTIVGSVERSFGEISLALAKYQTGELLSPYLPYVSNGTYEDLMAAQNEGLLVQAEGRYLQDCPNGLPGCMSLCGDGQTVLLFSEPLVNGEAYTVTGIVRSTGDSSASLRLYVASAEPLGLCGTR